jgi:two-component system, OmpR family, response regulator
MDVHGIGVPAAELDLGLTVDEHPEGWVLLIAPPESFHAPLCEALEGRGFGVVIRSSFEEALDACRSAPPRCFVCDGDLEHGTGLAIARALRRDRERGSLPIVCLAADDARREGALAVADAALPKDLAAEAAAVQIDALVRMADRIDEGHEEAASPARAFAGDLAHVSLQTLLDVLSLERRSGTLTVVSDGLRAEFGVADGCVVTARLDGQPEAPLGAVRATLAVVAGRFSFSTERPLAEVSGAADLRELTIEALRLTDEENRKAAERRVRRRPVRGVARTVPGRSRMVS